MTRQIEVEFGHAQQLILIGKERGYLLYDEVNESLPTDVNSSQEIESRPHVSRRFVVMQFRLSKFWNRYPAREIA